MIKISNPFFDRKTQTLVISVLKSGKVSEGEMTSRFETALARTNNAKYAICFNSGTAALHSILASLNLKPSSEIITSPFTFVATANTILMSNLVPIFCDIEEESFNIDPQEIEKRITKKTAAILTVDLYGLPCKYEKIQKLAKKHKLFLISDSCQAIGATYKNKPIANYTDATVFSFYATKNLTTCEGGAIVTNNKKMADFCRSFKNHGRGKKQDDFRFLGYNYRTTEINSAIGLEQIKKLKKWTMQRQKNAKLLSNLLKNKEGIITPYVPTDSNHTYQQYTIHVTSKFPVSRNNLLSYLNNQGVQAKVYYPRILSEYKHIAETINIRNKLIIAKKTSQEILSLPIHPFLSKKDIKKIANLILKIK